MPVGQPVLDTNYQTLKHWKTWNLFILQQLFFILTFFNFPSFFLSYNINKQWELTSHIERRHTTTQTRVAYFNSTWHAISTYTPQGDILSCNSLNLLKDTLCPELTHKKVEGGGGGGEEEEEKTKRKKNKEAKKGRVLREGERKVGTKGRIKKRTKEPH